MANWTATLAAITARGPRCERCGAWTFRPEYGRLPRFVARLCPTCLPLGNIEPKIKKLLLCQIFKKDLDDFIRYPADRPIRL